MSLLQTFEKELRAAEAKLTTALINGAHADLYSVGKLQGMLAGLQEARDILQALLSEDEDRRANL